MLLWVLLPPLTAQVSFEKSVKPMLAERCGTCHGQRNGAGKLSVSSVSSLLVGGASGPAIRPGKPDGSLLVSVISGDKPRMPKFGQPLNADQVAVVRRWIEEGARDDSTGGGDGSWWSLKPLNRPPVPSMSDGWGSTPIDAFIISRLRAAGIAPSPEADRRILIRRLYFDLHGLPPTPD